jgi:hypothetical protein
MILVQQSPTTLLREHGPHPNLGVLSGPRRVYKNVEGWLWAADNDAFLAWDEDRFVTMLDKITGIPGCLFVVAPDVVGDAEATLERFHEWAYRIRETGQPVAFVAQDGIEDHPVPWGIVDALFIGGTTEFKMGSVAAAYAREAKQRGKWLHMGRVNTRRRIRYAKSLGCDSIDGTNFSMFRRTALPWALTWASAEQLWAASPEGAAAP